MQRRRSWSAFGGALMILGLGACGERDMLGPEANPASVVIIRDAAQLNLLFVDVRDRIVGNLPEHPPRGELAAAIQHLVTALQAGSLGPAEKAFAAAYQAARRYSDQLQDPSAEADLAALWLAMEILTQSLRESGA